MEIESPSTPALAGATAEYEKVMTDPTHEHYAGLRRGDKAANDYVDSLYRKALPNNAPVPLTDEGISASTASSEDDWQAQTEVETALRQEFGEHFDTIMSQMSVGAKYLFDGNEGQHALIVLTDRMSALGPKGEALGVKFLADLAHLQSQGGIKS